MDMLNEFITNQEKIYDKARAFMSTPKPLKPASAVLEGQGGYLVVFRPNEDIAGRIAEYGQRLSTTFPGFSYGKEVLHHTISDYLLSKEFKPDRVVLDQLAWVVSHQMLWAPKIQLKEWIYTENTVMIRGTPDKAFLNTAFDIIDVANQQQIPLRKPWGAHTTVLRVTKEQTPEQLGAFYELVKQAPQFGESKAQAVDVGYFTMNEHGFDYVVHERFQL